MDLPASLALITLFLTLGAFGYWRLRKPAADREYRFGGREAEQQPTAVTRTIQQVIAHDKKRHTP